MLHKSDHIQTDRALLCQNTGKCVFPEWYHSRSYPADLHPNGTMSYLIVPQLLLFRSAHLRFRVQVPDCPMQTAGSPEHFSPIHRWHTDSCWSKPQWCSDSLLPPVLPVLPAPSEVRSWCGQLPLCCWWPDCSQWLLSHDQLLSLFSPQQFSRLLRSLSQILPADYPRRSKNDHLYPQLPASYSSFPV